MTAVPPELETDDWREAFDAAGAPSVACPHVAGHGANVAPPCLEGLSTDPFGREAVSRVVALCEGRPPAIPWLGVFELEDGRFAAVRALRCGAGWRCHVEGSALVARALGDLLQFGLSAAEQARAGLQPT